MYLHNSAFPCELNLKKHYWLEMWLTEKGHQPVFNSQQLYGRRKELIPKVILWLPHCYLWMFRDTKTHSYTCIPICIHVHIQIHMCMCTHICKCTINKYSILWIKVNFISLWISQFYYSHQKDDIAFTLTCHFSSIIRTYVVLPLNT